MRNSLEHKDQNGESGAALITALLIVSVMSITALVVIENLRFSMKLAANFGQREQARLYALGAEQLSKETILAARKVTANGDDERYPALDEWTRKPVFFPIEGGSIKGRVADGSNCFNLNALVNSGENLALVRDQEASAMFEILLENVGVSKGDTGSLVSSVVDWIDSNSSPGFGGAEDPDYAVMEPPYRTGQTFLADISELKVIKGFTPLIVEALRPWVCVRPNMLLNELNINTLSQEDLPLILAYLGEDFDEVGVNTILAERPVSGFSNTEELFALSVFENKELSENSRQLFGVSSEFFELNAQISYYQSVISLHSVLQISRGGDITVISRRYGTF